MRRMGPGNGGYTTERQPVSGSPNVPGPAHGKGESSHRGFTLIEMLVALTVVGILAASLGLLFSGMTSTMQVTDAEARMLENLSLASQKIADDLRNFARNNPPVRGDAFHMIGVDADGDYVNADLTDHNTLVNGRSNWDRLHLHRLDRDSRLSGTCGNGGVCSDRVYHAYWINGAGSSSTVDGLQGTWGLARRRLRHTTRGETLPQLNGSSTPSLTLDDASLTLTGSEAPVSFRVDYLSLRYYDSANDDWVNCWDTRGNAPCGTPSSYRLPGAVQFTLRGYDPREDEGSGSEDVLNPRWYETTVDLR